MDILEKVTNIIEISSLEKEEIERIVSDLEILITDEMKQVQEVHIPSNIISDCHNSPVAEVTFKNEVSTYWCDVCGTLCTTHKK